MTLTRGTPCIYIYLTKKKQNPTEHILAYTVIFDTEKVNKHTVMVYEISVFVALLYTLYKLNHRSGPVRLKSVYVQGAAEHVCHIPCCKYNMQEETNSVCDQMSPPVHLCGLIIQNQ